MNFYEFTYEGGARDWVYAPGEEEAKQFYIDQTGCHNIDGYTVRLVPEDEWQTTYILDSNESEPDEDEEEYNEDDYHNGYKILMNFKEYAEKNTSMDMVATSEF